MGEPKLFSVQNQSLHDLGKAVFAILHSVPKSIPKTCTSVHCSYERFPMCGIAVSEEDSGAPGRRICDHWIWRRSAFADQQRKQSKFFRRIVQAVFFLLWALAVGFMCANEKLNLIKSVWSLEQIIFTIGLGDIDQGLHECLRPVV